MKTTHLALAAVVVLLGCFTSACVMQTTVKNEARQSIRFSTPQAAQSFYDAYLAAGSPSGHGSVAIYVALPYWHRTVPTDNVRFNAAVQSADTDRDGLISDAEAVAYAAKLQKQSS